MNAENFSEWHRRQNHNVIRTPSSYWYEAASHVYQAFPYHWVISPSEAEIKKLLVQYRLIAVRYSTPLEAPIGKISYHITQYPPYSMENMRKNTRRQLREGLKRFTIEEVSLSCLATEGWDLQYETMGRHGRVACMCQKEWELLCLSAQGIPGFAAWGAHLNGKLVSFLLTARIDDTGYLLYSACQNDCLNLHVNKVIFYDVSCRLLKEEGMNSLFLTVQSLDAPASVDIFKFRMGFQPKYVRQRVVFHPLVQPFINKLTHKLVQFAFHKFPDNPILPKAEGMIRFYREGKMSAEKQNLPNCDERENGHPLETTILVESG